MPDVKISALPAATTPLAGTEVLPIVQGTSTVKVANNDLRPKQIQSNTTSGVLQVTGPAAASTRVMTTPDANFTAARTDAAQSFTGDQTLTTGNLVIGTSGKGIDFSATASGSGTMTSELFSDYEEGTWTPSVGGDATYYVQEGYYTKVGKLVFIRGKLVINVLGTGSTTLVSGLPYTSATSIQSLSNTIGINYYNSLAVNALSLNGVIASNTTNMSFNVSTSAGVTTTSASAAIFGNIARIDFSGCYQTAA